MQCVEGERERRQVRSGQERRCSSPALELLKLIVCSVLLLVIADNGRGVQDCV